MTRKLTRDVQEEIRMAGRGAGRKKEILQIHRPPFRV